MESVLEHKNTLNLVDEEEFEALQVDSETQLEGPQIGYVEDEVDEPIVGKTFTSIDDMFSFYNEYAKQIGFPVVRRSTKKENGEVKYATFACARGGKLKSSSKNRLKPRPTTKTNCKAKLAGSLDAYGIWRINSVELEHNHELSPSKSRFFRCNREISSGVKRRLEINDMAGIRLNKNFNSFVVEAGGHENVPFLEKDCRNYMEKVRRLQLAEGDATAIQNYFLKMQAENSDFFFSMDLDDEGRLKNVFWADARSRAAYKEFGQVITFDTTYLTNKYDMPFAPFVGVNHHGQSTLLGCGLISSEDTATFIWLFQTWLACMSGCAPNGIITDQDKAMKKAIEIVFPNTRHRWCLWHIMKKFHEKLGSYKNYEAISSSLQDVVYDSESPGAFEEQWLFLIQKYALSENTWLEGLYSERHRWVPCYVKDSFWAGMSTTQRSESINAFFDGYVNSKTTLKQFVEQYGNALARKVENEAEENYRSSYKKIPCVTEYIEMEEQAQEVYTISKFQEFQAELVGKMYCDFLSSKYEDMIQVCDIKENVKIGELRKRMIFKVSFKEDECDVRCSCKKFEFRGILCRHALTVLLRNDVLKIPDKYIIRFWRKDVRRCHTRVKISYNRRSTTVEQSRFDEMNRAFSEVSDLAADSEEGTKYVMELICSAKKELLKDGAKFAKPITTPVNDGQTILDPVVTRKKGRPPSKRKESKICKGQKKKNKHVLSQEGTVVTKLNERILGSKTGISLSQENSLRKGNTTPQTTTIPFSPLGIFPSMPKITSDFSRSKQLEEICTFPGHAYDVYRSAEKPTRL